MRRLEIHYHVTLRPRRCRRPPSFLGWGCVLYVTPIAAINWVLNRAPDSAAAVVLFWAKITREEEGLQKAKMMIWVGGMLAGLPIFFIWQVVVPPRISYI